MKTLLASFLLGLLLVGWSATSLANTSQSDMLSMLDQLDQLDRTDFDDAIKAIYDCSDRKDFSCADKKAKLAKSLIANAKDKKSLREAKQYRQKTAEFAKAEERQLARVERQKTCASRCPIDSEYNRCVDDRLSARNCSSRSVASYTPTSNLDMLNNALQQLNKHTQNYFQQKQRLLQQQQDAYAQQRRQKQRQQRVIAQQKRDWERAQAQQRQHNQQRADKLATLRKQQQRMRQQAEQRRQKARRLEVAQTRQNRPVASQQRPNVTPSTPAKLTLTGEVLTWKNTAGKWWSCGPIQCIWTGEDSEKEAIGYVVDDNRMTYTYNGPVGKCKSYTVTGLESYDASSEKVRKLAKCF